MESPLIGALKVKDGMFIGDEYSAQDLEFVVANKVGFIINCASRQIPNHWEPIGVKYLSFPWLDHDSQLILDTADRNFTLIYQFIEQAQSTGESLLIHSVRGRSRCLCVAAVYLLYRFRWSLDKTLSFLNSRRPDIDLKQGFISQLLNFEKKMNKKGLGPRTQAWEEAPLDSEDLVLTNTFVNSQLRPQSAEDSPRDCAGVIKVNWADEAHDRLTDIPHSSSKNPLESGFAILRSCLKGGSRQEHKVPLCRAKPGRSRSTVLLTGNTLTMPKSQSFARLKVSGGPLEGEKATPLSRSALKGIHSDLKPPGKPQLNNSRVLRIRPRRKLLNRRPVTAPHKF